MNRYLALSSLIHAAGLGGLLIVVTRAPAPTAYYGFQFLGGQSGFGTGRLEPAPAPIIESSGVQAPNMKKEKLPSSDDSNRVAVTKKKPTKNQVVSSAKKPPNKKTGVHSGRGDSALGRGDFQGSKTGPVGGVGTSLEIGGFGPGGAGGGGTPFPFKWYAELVYKRLWESWDRTDAGILQCKISFRITKSGKIEGIKMVRSSGDSLFDLNAKRAVLAASPFPPLPEGFTETELPSVVVFKLQ